MSNESIILLSICILVPSIGAVAWYFMRKMIDQKRTLEKVHLQILIPRKDAEADMKHDTTKDFKDYIGLMEQLLVAMNSIYSHRILNRIR